MLQAYADFRELPRGASSGRVSPEISFPESVADRMPLGAHAQFDIDTVEEEFDVALGNSKALCGPRFGVAFAAPIEGF